MFGVYINMHPIVFVSVLFSTAHPFFKRFALTTMSVPEYMLVMGLLCLVGNVIAFSITSTFSTINLNKWVFISALNTFINSFVYMYALKLTDPGVFVAVTQPAIILITLVVDHFNGNKLIFTQWIGAILVALGVILLRYK